MRQNPYTVENLAEAMNEIYRTNIDKVSTTHWYVKFNPESDTDIAELANLDLVLFDFPTVIRDAQVGHVVPLIYWNVKMIIYQIGVVILIPIAILVYRVILIVKHKVVVQEEQPLL